jgi:Domain of unknown function (DUF4124)
MRKWLILLSVLSMTTASATPAWTWVDKDGTVHFSDLPVPGAKQIDLRDAQSFGRPTQPAASTASTGSASSAPAADRYRTFNVTSPTQQQTLWNIGGNLPVTVQIEPALQSGQHFDVFLDGQRLNLNETSSQFTVPNVVRGLHTLQVAVFDSSGSEVVRSLATTFMVQQTSILNPNAPLARPKPPPPPAGN